MFIILILPESSTIGFISLLLQKLPRSASWVAPKWSNVRTPWSSLMPKPRYQPPNAPWHSDSACFASRTVDALTGRHAGRARCKPIAPRPRNRGDGLAGVLGREPQN